MTCATCIHSIGAPDGLWCSLHRKFAVIVCRAYMREPGSEG
jgi:hypothetical protein